MINPPKGVIHKSTFNLCARSNKNIYNIVEDLAQAPSTMSNLKVLQNCLGQKKDFLSTIGCIDPSDSNIVVFNHENDTPRLPTKLDFMIQVVVCGKNIHRSIVDEGASTYIMSLSYWKAIGSLQLNQPPTTLKFFDGRTYKPCGILNSLQVKLGGKILLVEVEVIDRPLDYNILVGHTWVYAMTVVVSTYF